MSEKTGQQQKIDRVLSSSSLRHVGISLVSSKTSIADIEYLAEQIPHGNEIPSLQLTGCEMDDSFVPALLKVFGKFDKLSKIDLTYNAFTADGLAELAKGMPKVEELDVSYNLLGPKGGEVLVDMLGKNAGLRVLDASNASLGDEGISTLVEALGKNTSLFNVNYAQNGTSAETDKQTLDALLKNNRGLTKITVDSAAVEHHGDIREAIKNTPNKNLVRFAVVSAGNDVGGISGIPINSDCLMNNYDSANHLRSSIRGDLTKLNAQTLRQIEARHNAIFDNSFSNLRDGRMEEYNAFIDTLPKLPADKTSYPNALFEEDSRGFSPLDNPRLLSPENKDEFFRATPLNDELLSRTTARQGSILSTITTCLPTESLVEYCNSNGIQLGKKELLDEEGKPNPFLSTLIEKGETSALFSLENWAGKSNTEMQKVYKALPPSEQQKIGLFSLAQQMKNSAQSSGVGR